MRQFKINPRWRQCIISCVLLGQEGIFFIMVKIYNIRCMCDNGLWECKFVARGIHELHKHHGTAMTMKISWLLFTSIIENRLLCSKLCNSLPGFFLQKDMLVKHLKIMHCSMSNVNCLSPYWFPLSLYIPLHDCKIMKAKNNVYSWHHELQLLDLLSYFMNRIRAPWLIYHWSNTADSYGMNTAKCF